VTDKKRPTSLEATLVSLAGAGVSNKDMLEQIRKLYPDASKKDIIHAAFKTLIALSAQNPDASLRLQDFALTERGPDIGYGGGVPPRRGA